MSHLKSLTHLFPQLSLIDFSKSTDFECDPSKTILYSPQWREGEILELATHGHFQCFLNSNNDNFQSELLSAAHIQNDPYGFLQNPLPALFQNPPTALILSFQKKSDKIELMRQYQGFIAGTNSRLAQENAQVIFEELFMNAILDAPAESKKRGLPIRSKECQFIFAYDQEKLVVSCFDSCGSLYPLSLIKRIHAIYNQGTKDIINLDQRKGGAGIGCSLLHRYSSSLIVVVDEGQGTRVTCTIPLKMSQKKFYLLSKNLQVINLTSVGGHYGKQRKA